MSPSEGLTIQKQSRATLLKQIAYRKFGMPDSSSFSSSSKKHPHPSPLPEGEGTDRGEFKSYADL